jgi:hypothetical protein
MLKMTPINIPKDIFVVAKIHTPPRSERAAHTAKMIKNT